IGVIDIGTNSTRFLVTDTSGGLLRVIGSGLISTRLGEGLASGALADRAADRTIAALKQFMAQVRRLQPDRVAAVATSAVRDAANRDAFLRRVKDETGLAVQVLSGPEEARMSYLGVVKGLNAPMERALVIDIGGGSTEFIWRNDTGDISYRSTQAGAVRMTEGGHGLKKIRDVLRPVIVEISTARPRNMVGVGGTVTTLAAIDQALDPYNPEKVHGYYLSKEKIMTVLRDLTAKNPEERAGIPGLQSERADIIVAGVQIAVVILEELRLPGITASETDIMYGVAYNLLEKIYG
ncbi:MAG: Ppx/GppA family phosphatase, partial [Bacillota bacterium]